MFCLFLFTHQSSLHPSHNPFLHPPWLQWFSWISPPPQFPSFLSSVPRRQNSMAQRWEASLLANQKKEWATITLNCQPMKNPNEAPRLLQSVSSWCWAQLWLTSDWSVVLSVGRPVTRGLLKVIILDKVSNMLSNQMSADVVLITCVDSQEAHPDNNWVWNGNHIYTTVFKCDLDFMDFRICGILL